MNIIVGIVVRQLDRTELDLREQDQSSSIGSNDDVIQTKRIL